MRSPEHHQRHLGAVHPQLHDEGRDLAGEVVVTTLPRCFVPSHHGPDPRPEGAAAEAGCPHHGGEDLGGVDVADGQGVDGGHAARQVQNQDGPLVRKLDRGNGLERCKIFEYSCVISHTPPEG